MNEKPGQINQQNERFLRMNTIWASPAKSPEEAPAFAGHRGDFCPRRSDYFHAMSVLPEKPRTAWSTAFASGIN